MLDIIAEKRITQIELMVLDTQGIQVDVVNGELIYQDKDESVSSELHGAIEALLVFFLLGYVRTRKLGRIYTGDTVFVLDGTPDDIRLSRKPDVAFIRAERLAEIDREGYCYLIPDLVVEVISPSETVKAIQDKLDEYLQHGVLEVWQVFPRSRQIIIQQAEGQASIFSQGQTLTSQLLPDFELNLAEVFEGQA